MVNAVSKNIECGNCGKKLKVTMLNCINVTLNPKLRKMILKNDLFYFYCDRCKKKIRVLYPFLYHDMNNDFMIYFLPDEIKEKSETDFLQIYPEIINIPKRIVNSVSMLKEEILILENKLSDDVVYAIKFALTQILKKNSLKSIEGYFYGLSKINKDLKFIFFIDKKVVYKKVNFDIYNELSQLNANKLEESNFIELDKTFKRKII